MDNDFKFHNIVKVPDATLVMSSAIEEVERQGYRVMVAIVDVEHPEWTKEDRLMTFCDVESKSLRKVIYDRIEEEYE